FQGQATGNGAGVPPRPDPDCRQDGCKASRLKECTCPCRWQRCYRLSRPTGTFPWAFFLPLPSLPISYSPRMIEPRELFPANKAREEASLALPFPKDVRSNKETFHVPTSFCRAGCRGGRFRADLRLCLHASSLP